MSCNVLAGGAADAALKQVDLLKRELAEMRSGNLADEHAMHDLQQMAAVERAVNKARGITSAADAENEHEKSAHRETQDALEESERTVSVLLFYVLWLLMDRFCLLFPVTQLFLLLIFIVHVAAERYS